jgi:hypothetical protein
VTWQCFLVVALSLATHAFVYLRNRAAERWRLALSVATSKHFREMAESHARDCEIMREQRDATDNATKKRAASLMGQGMFGLSVAYKDAAETVNWVLVQGRKLEDRPITNGVTNEPP